VILLEKIVCVWTKQRAIIWTFDLQVPKVV